MAVPIVVFAYRRTEHLQRTLSSLIQCEGFAGSPVIVYGDGPKTAKEIPDVEATRRLAHNMLGKTAEYHFSPINKGLSRSIIEGVGAVTRRFGRAIVVEDDLLLAPGFLNYMNTALDRYAEDSAVLQVSGYMFDVPEFNERRDAFFLPLTVSWGWATWRRAWDVFDPEVSGWEKMRPGSELRRRFNLGGAYDYASLLEDQIAGRADSWAILWYWTVFRAGGLVLFPPRSLVENAGMDGSGTHGRGRLTKFRMGHRVPVLPVLIGLPNELAIDAEVLVKVRAAIWRQNGGWLGQVKTQLVRMLKSIF